jgi:MscS family membrane protein
MHPTQSLPRTELGHVAIAALAFALTLLLAGGTAARAAEEPEVVEAGEEAAEDEEVDYSKPAGPPDPFNRGTPRGSMNGYLVAARDGDYERATEFLDLRRLPPGQRTRGLKLARQLKVVLDRTLWVDLETFSGSNDGLGDDGLPAWQDRLADIETAEGLVTLLLQRVPREGDSVRIWKISSSTVARTPALYVELGPGRLEELLPPIFFEVKFLEVALWQWLALPLLGLLGALLSLLFAGPVVRALSSILVRREGTLDSRVIHLVVGPIRTVMAVFIFRLGHAWMGLDVAAQQVLHTLEQLLLVVAFSWLVFRLIDLAVVVLRARAERLETEGLVPVLAPSQLFVKVIVVTIGFLAGLSSLGVNITAALAGLGVGGIAVALAAQKTIENLFGGITLFADRPVRLGDFFRFGDQVGTVEEIGLRSTRIRTLDRTVISIPNADISNMPLENFGKRDEIRLWTTLSVRYETTPDQIRFLLARLREILLAHPRITPDPARVRLVGFGHYSIDLEVTAYVDTDDWNEFLGIREDILLRFMAAIAEAGTAFAIPTQTNYIGRDEGLNADRALEAEQRVADWCSKGELPFPAFPDQFSREVENTLDWPPAGSPQPGSRE